MEESIEVLQIITNLYAIILCIIILLSIIIYTEYFISNKKAKEGKKLIEDIKEQSNENLELQLQKQKNIHERKKYEIVLQSIKNNYSTTKYYEMIDRELERYEKAIEKIESLNEIRMENKKRNGNEKGN